MKKVLVLLGLLMALGASALEGITASVDGVRVNNGKKEAQAERERIIRELEGNMVYVESGTFMMGATNEQDMFADDEKPVHQMTLSSFHMSAHQVTLSSFYICKYEVTQELWTAVMGSNPSEFKGAKRPVEQVSWEDCQTFITKLNQLTGKNYRLPTEAEWEYAARGGNRSNGYKYAGSNTIEDVAWYDCKSGTHDVGTKRANELGLYDMTGNVLEWCGDWSGSYSSRSQTNPKGAFWGDVRVCRGGCWLSPGWDWCVSDRGGCPPTQGDCFIGLRLTL